MALSFEECHLHHFDPDVLKSALDSTEIEHRVLAGSSLDVRSSKLRWGDLSISVCDYSFPTLVRGCMPLDGGVYVGLLGRSIGDVHLNLQPLPLNQLLLYAPGSEAQYHAHADSEWMMLRFPLERLRQAAIVQRGVDLDWPSQGVRRIQLPPNGGDQLRRALRGLLRFGRNFSGESDLDSVETLISEGLVKLLIETIFSEFPSSVNSLPPARKRALNTLELNIERWLNDPYRGLSVADIKGTSQRTLEIATRDAYGVTPHQWIKLARLNAAYRHLFSGRCTSVTDVCTLCGFHHMGRFAGEYRVLFGETPRETLKKRKYDTPAEQTSSTITMPR